MFGDCAVLLWHSQSISISLSGRNSRHIFCMYSSSRLDKQSLGNGFWKGKKKFHSGKLGMWMAGVKSTALQKQMRSSVQDRPERKITIL